MRLILLSDTHTLHRVVKVPDGDVVIHCGDFSNGDVVSAADFVMWFERLPHKRKILIAGNHDRLCETIPDVWRSILSHQGPSIIYLEGDSVEIKGIRFWGSPYTPEFFDWAFNVKRGLLHEHWDKIPNNTDVLITHGPAYGILDIPQTTIIGQKDHCGCKELSEAIKRVKPKLHAFGHIHYSYGMHAGKDTASANVSICGENYKPTRQPFIYDLPTSKEVSGPI